ncbi:MAG: immunoglobulin domain-containing protein, partial [Limisphaerales bacterium]
GKYNVYAWFSGNSSKSSKTPVFISYFGGTLTTNLNQTVGGTWVKVASGLDFEAGTSGFLRIANDTGENILINKAVVADAFRFSLAEPPSIILNPVSKTVTNGGGATFSVEVYASGPLRYQWKFNGVNVPGATNSSVTFTNLTMANSGQVTVEVSNDSGSITSLPAQLLVKLAVNPRFGLISRLSDGRFQFEGEGDKGTYFIDISTNLVDWVTASSMLNTNGTFMFSDNQTNLPARFYRIRWEE